MSRIRQAGRFVYHYRSRACRGIGERETPRGMIEREIARSEAKALGSTPANPCHRARFEGPIEIRSRCLMCGATWRRWRQDRKRWVVLEVRFEDVYARAAIESVKPIMDPSPIPAVRRRVPCRAGTVEGD